MIASERWVRHAGELRTAPSVRARNWSPLRTPQPSMSLQSSAPIQAKLGVVCGWARSALIASSGTTCVAQYAGAIANVGEVQKRQIVVPVVAVDGVVARSGGALEVGAPGLVRGADQIADVAARTLKRGLISSGSVSGIPNAPPAAIAR